jgi:hypothetical protein
MAKKTRKQMKTAEKKMSPRMRRFIDNLINEAEEAGIKPEDAADDSDAGATSSSSAYVGFSRHRRQESV